MNLLLGFYIVCAVLNCVLMVTLREAFVENGKSHRIWLLATLVLTLLSLSVWIVGAVVIGCDISIRMISGKKVDYGDGDKHCVE
ncbi:MAG: hypothetical protein SPH99_01275 [Sodaliphilus sp.]|nr:hypothetical protein [Sodaliphilus sp.]